MTKITKGLFIGIDYLNSPNQLYNCRNDAKDMQKLINDKFGIQESILLLDDSTDDKKPTKENILKWFNWLANNNKNGDNLWIHYSGHGSTVIDLSGDEKDGYDETMVPVDFMTKGQILDDDINTILCKPIVYSGATLYFHDDCCHSGTAADLKYRLIESEIKDNVIGYSRYEYFTDIYGYYKKKLLDSVSKIRNGNNIFEIKENGHDSLIGPGQVIKWSGCMDNQTSADGFKGMANGAMTGCVITVLNNDKIVTWGEFLIEIRRLLKENYYVQIPQLCFNLKIDFNDKCFDL
jgi:hypothetical protein